jgi:nucleotide-binding universal stress UspA family protein
LLKGVVSHEIVRKVEEWCVDLLVLGELGPVSSRADAFLKESDRILRNAKCSVIVVKNAERVERIYNSLETKK